MTKEELRNKFFMDCTDMNDGTPKVDMSPHNVFEWINRNIIEQKLIAQEPKQREVSKDLQYQNLTCLVNGFELTTYQKELAKQEYKKLLAMKEREAVEVDKKIICRNCKSTAVYQEVGTFICGECNASW